MHLSMQSSGYWFKKYEFTTIVLKTTNPYLLDQVEFKHQFVKFKAGHVFEKLCLQIEEDMSIIFCVAHEQ